MENYNQQYAPNQSFDRGLLNTLEVDNSVKMNLAEAAKWAKFMGIVGLVMIVLMVFGGIATIAMGTLLFDQSPDLQNLPFSPAILGLIYIGCGLIYLYPTWTLLRFGSQTRYGIKNENQVQFTKGLKNLMNSFKFVGILTIVIIVVYIVGIIVIFMGLSPGMLN